MSDTVTVRVADGDVWIDGEHYTHGETLELDVDVYERIPKSFVKVDGEDESDDADEFDADGFVGRTPMGDVVEDIESGDFDARLDEIEAAEEAGRSRSGVLGAVDSQRGE